MIHKMLKTIAKLYKLSKSRKRLYAAGKTSDMCNYVTADHEFKGYGLTIYSGRQGMGRVLHPLKKPSVLKKRG